MNEKKNKKPSEGEIERTAVSLKEDAVAVGKNREGSLYSNGAFEDARLSDMFEGDEIDNTARVDISKVRCSSLR